MPDNFMPDVEVHIAFNAGYTTPAASRTWTDVSQYVELHDGIDIDFGRKDEQSVADANTMTLTLDNSDGRFTAGRAASPYSPNVKIGRPIRVRVTPPGGTMSTRFVGFIDEWPVEWEGTSNYAKAKIRASSRLSRLGLSAKLRSMPEAEILASRPVRYWTLGDPTGSTTASESSGNAGFPLSMLDVISGNPLPAANPVFGEAMGPPTDEMTAVTFTGHDTATAPCKALVLPAGDSNLGFLRGMRFSVLVNAIGSISANLATVTTSGGVFGVLLNTSGTVGTALGMVGPNIADGRTHDVALMWDASNTYLIVDGVVAATGSAGPTSATIRSAEFGSALSGVMAHAAIWNSANPPSVAMVQEQAAVMTAASAVERTDERVVRALGWVGVPSSEVTADTGAETMAYQKTDGQSVVDVLREAESTEGGVLLDDRDGNVRFRNRSHRYLASPVATLNMAAQHVGADYSPKLDRSTLLNDVEVSNPTTGEKARSASKVSSDEYGIATGSETSVASTYDALQQKAAWLIASYAEPRNRAPSLTVDVLAHQGLTPSAQTLLAVTVGDLLAVTNAPTQSDSTSPSYFVEGYTENIGPESYEISFNLSPSHPSLSTLVLDSATRGLLDTGILAL